MYEITIAVIQEGEVVGTIALKTDSRANARAIVMLADENKGVIEAVATKSSAPRVVKFKGVGDVAPQVAPKGKKGRR